MKKIILGFSFWGIFLLLFIVSACSNSSDSSPRISGTISYTMDRAPSACYVLLDDDTDPDNGYIKRVTIDITDSTTTSVAYDIDTADVPTGIYYLEAAWDFGSGNMDPDNDSVWEAKAWFGGVGSSPPSAANISDLSRVYNITLTGLN